MRMSIGYLELLVFVIQWETVANHMQSLTTITTK